MFLCKLWICKALSDYLLVHKPAPYSTPKHGGQGEQERGRPSGWAGGGFNMQGTYTWGLSCKTTWSLHPYAWILKVYKETLTGTLLSHYSAQTVSTSLYSLKSASLKLVPTLGMGGGCPFQGQGKGEAPPITQVHLAGGPAAMTSWWPPPTPHPLRQALTISHDLTFAVCPERVCKGSFEPGGDSRRPSDCVAGRDLCSNTGTGKRRHSSRWFSKP